MPIYVKDILKQSDWDDANSNSASHIKNKPFYKTEQEVTDNSGVSLNILNIAYKFAGERVAGTDGDSTLIRLYDFVNNEIPVYHNISGNIVANYGQSNGFLWLNKKGIMYEMYINMGMDLTKSNLVDIPRYKISSSNSLTFSGRMYITDHVSRDDIYENKNFEFVINKDIFDNNKVLVNSMDDSDYYQIDITDGDYQFNLVISEIDTETGYFTIESVQLKYTGNFTSNPTPNPNRYFIYLVASFTGTYFKTINLKKIDSDFIPDEAFSTYNLPLATSNTLGGIKIGDGLSIDANGVVSANTGATVGISTSLGTATAVNNIYSVSVTGSLLQYDKGFIILVLDSTSSSINYTIFLEKEILQTVINNNKTTFAYSGFNIVINENETTSSIGINLEGYSNISVVIYGVSTETVPDDTSNLATVAFSGNYNDLTNKPTIPTLATVATSGDYNDLTNKPTIPTVPTLATVATSGNYNDLTNKPTIPTVPTLADVATSGSYNDLDDKPTIPSSISDLSDGASVATQSYVSTNYVNKTDVANSANKIPRFSSEGHLVLPTGIEIY